VSFPSSRLVRYSRQSPHLKRHPYTKYCAYGEEPNFTMQNCEKEKKKQVPLIWIRPRAPFQASPVIIPTSFRSASRAVRTEERCTRHFSSLLAPLLSSSSDCSIATATRFGKRSHLPCTYTFPAENRQKHGVSKKRRHVARGCNAGRHRSIAGGRRTEM
jgi:hypothetical protein